MWGGGTVVFLILLGFFAADPFIMDGNARSLPPSFAHWFGTDNFGRDLFSRCMIGLRYSLGIALLSLAFSLGLGFFIACAAVFAPRPAERLVMRALNALAAVPLVLFALVLRGVFAGGLLSLVLTIAVIFIPTFSRLIRNEIALALELDYAQYARVLGAGKLRVLCVHILPNIRRPVISASIAVLTRAILVESALSYLGVGLRPPLPGLGLLLADAQAYLLSTPWAALAPGLTLAVIVYACNMAGEALHD